MAIKRSVPVLRVKELRIKAGLSQNALAKMANVSQSHISEIESGVKRVGLGITKKLATALDCSIEDLVNEDSDMDDIEDDLKILELAK